MYLEGVVLVTVGGQWLGTCWMCWCVPSGVTSLEVADLSGPSPSHPVPFGHGLLTGLLPTPVRERQTVRVGGAPLRLVCKVRLFSPRVMLLCCVAAFPHSACALGLLAGGQATSKSLGFSNDYSFL